MGRTSRVQSLRDLVIAWEGCLFLRSRECTGRSETRGAFDINAQSSKMAGFLELEVCQLPPGNKGFWSFYMAGQDAASFPLLSREGVIGGSLEFLQ